MSKHLRCLLTFLVVVFCYGLSMAQNGAINGSVYDEAGDPVIGASVSIEGTSLGAVTDVDGGFIITGVTPGVKSLVVTYVGYETQKTTVTVGNSPVQVSFNFKPDAKVLDEVVVVGYGTQSRREVTGAITKVESGKITSVPTPSFESALQGRAAGVQVTQGSGLAGSGAVVRIRGISSISAGGDPLYVIDGIPVTQDQFTNGNRGAFNLNPLAAINPNDIESIEILKDAGAAGIYGSRGANGVILVTTKRGTSRKPQYSFGTRLGVATWTMRPKFVSGSEWLQLRQEAWENDGNSGLADLPGGLTWDQARQNNTDWWDVATRNGFQHETNFSVKGGSKKWGYFFSGTNSNQQSYIENNGYARVGARGNIDFRPNDKLRFSLSQGWNRGRNNRVFNAWNGGLGAAMSVALPIYPIYNADGSYFNNGVREMDNATPNIQMVLDGTKWRTTDTRSLTNLQAEYKPLKWLSLVGSANLDYTDITDDRWMAANVRGTTETQNQSQRWPSWITNYNYNGYAQASLLDNQTHKLSLMVGSEYQESSTRKYNAITATGVDVNAPFYENPSLLENAIFEKPNPADNTDTKLLSDRFNFISGFSRINYTLLNKYVIQASARYDGSSRFGSNNQFAFFPTVSAAWLINEEGFMKNQNLFSTLKLRGGIGLTGNSNIPSNVWRGTFSSANPGYNGQDIKFVTRLENPDLRWETTTNSDIALEFGILKDRITGEISAFRKITKDILVERNNPSSTGFDRFWGNVNGSEVLNEGLEFSIKSVNMAKKNFTWSTDFNISKYYNEILNLGDLTPDAAGGGTNDTRVAEGFPIGTNYLVRYSRVDPDDGRPIWLDANGNETKTFDLNNRVPVGRVVPDFVGGFGNTFRYKGFDLTGFFTFTIGGNIYDGSAKRQLGVNTWWNVRSEIADRWRKPGDIATLPRLTMDPATYTGLPSFWQYNSTLFLYDASYARLRELTLGYTIPASTMSKWGMSACRIYFTGMNLFTFTEYPGGDPEIARDFEGAQDRNMSPNITFLTVPQQKTYSFGVNFNF
jgi:TonB-dependent starch-binding outer membrane protein SusC